jgi:hypothetical protein
VGRKSIIFKEKSQKIEKLDSPFQEKTPKKTRFGNGVLLNKLKIVTKIIEINAVSATNSDKARI